ncbi:hypothetical protein BGZ80_010398 [Entomortierella chlamydospora]|uniref:Exonuclease domain-containing protein n=1 Tax=Entomortierella chlamydospora TaxID=101097 RepID=A0A9P6N2Q8_9FUNG|nr:hypothetical protein BGZ80_010398 [Entomortierella chlamydospora]
MGAGDKKKLGASSAEAEETNAATAVNSQNETSHALPTELGGQEEKNVVSAQSLGSPIAEAVGSSPGGIDGPSELAGEEDNTSKKRKVEGTDAGEGSVCEIQVTTAGISRKDRKIQKKFSKRQAKKSEGDGGRPCFMLSRDHDKLSVKDVRDLVMYLLTETKTLPWIMVRNKFNINKVVLLYVSGLDPKLFHVDLKDPESKKPLVWAELAKTGPATEFQQLRRFFDVMSVMKAGGDKYRVHPPIESLLSVSLSNSEKKKREHETRKMKERASSLKREDYMLGLEQLREHEFPLPSYLDPNVTIEEGWIETKMLTVDSPAPKKMIAMDCEMCRTTAGSELTRISLINEEGETIYDELVMPDNPIVDYLTQYSGMTAERLEGVKTRLVDVQKKLQELVTYDTILVGHSLENDMKVLKFAHPFIIDTTVIYHHTRGPPFRASLKWLAQKWLSRRIQEGGEHGHNSEEDAQACMDLAKLKIREGPGFGEYNQDQESLFSRIARHTSPRTSAVIGGETIYGESSATAIIKTKSDGEVVKAIPLAIKQHNFVWGRLRAMEINHGKAPVSLQGNYEPRSSQIMDNGSTSQIKISETAEAAEEEVREAARSIDKSIAEIVESLPEHTALIVTSGQGDIREVLRMQARQKKFQKLYNTHSLSTIPKEEQFLEEDQKALEEAVDKAKNGVCFFMVK